MTSQAGFKVQGLGVLRFRLECSGLGFKVQGLRFLMFRALGYSSCQHVEAYASYRLNT